MRAFLAVAALLAGVLAPALPTAPAGTAPHLAPHTGARTGPHADPSCAAGCDRTQLLSREAPKERHAPHPVGASLPPRALLPRPVSGTRPSTLPPDPTVRLRHTALHQGRAPPSSPGG